MKFKTNFFKNYLVEAPLPLAIERTLECHILSKQKFEHPILDIGCGEGLFAYILFDEKIDVGIEPQSRELVRAKEYGMYLELIQSYGDCIPKESKSFKTAFSNSVLEHIQDITPVLKEVHRLLDDDGVFYITVPTNLFDRYTVIYWLFSFFRLNKLAEKYRVMFNNFWKHYHYFDAAGWTALFDKAGFKVVNSVEYCDKHLAMLNDFLVPFSLSSFLQKKLFNSWFKLPFLRLPFARLYHFVFGNLTIPRDTTTVRGGLIFFMLRKKS